MLETVTGKGWSFPLRLFAVLGLLLTGCACAPPDFDETAWRTRAEAARTEDLYAPHGAEGSFFNPWMPMEERGFGGVLSWKLSRRDNPRPADGGFLPAVLPHTRERIKALPPEADFILWIGHATFLIRLGGQYWLTDPMFSERALLPKRKTPPALAAADFQALGIRSLNVIVSHNHYDHLDAKSIAALPDDTRFYVPLGLKGFITDLGRQHVVEMDWWQRADAGGAEVVCLPMQHWSRRIGQAINTTLWASFMIVTPAATVYFAGDSGYFTGYREISRLFPAIDYALMPTTAYLPRWFMHYAHMDIDEAIDAFTDLKARYFIPTQWGTFHLGDEPPGYPALELKRRISERNLDPARFRILDIGQIMPVAKQTK